MRYIASHMFTTGNVLPSQGEIRKASFSLMITVSFKRHYL